MRKWTTAITTVGVIAGSISVQAMTDTAANADDEVQICAGEEVTGRFTSPDSSATYSIYVPANGTLHIEGSADILERDTTGGWQTVLFISPVVTHTILGNYYGGPYYDQEFSNSWPRWWQEPWKGGVVSLAAYQMAGTLVDYRFTATVTDQTGAAYDDTCSVPTPPAETLRGGDLNLILAADPLPKIKKPFDGVVNACTAGFAARRKNGEVWVVTADHCRDLKADGRVVAQATVIDVDGRRTSGELRPLARGSNCVSQEGCIGGKKGVDAMAWRPDPGPVRVMPEIRTHHGVYPVLGSSDWTHGQIVCSTGITTNEQCGYILKKQAFTAGIVQWKDDDGDSIEHSQAGDSGGPVYSYVENPDGSMRGVLILGISNSFRCGSKNRVKDLNSDGTDCKADVSAINSFVPVSTVMDALGVSVLTAS